MNGMKGRGGIHGEADGCSKGDGDGDPLVDAAATQTHNIDGEGAEGAKAVWGMDSAGERGGGSINFFARPCIAAVLFMLYPERHSPLCRQHTFRG